MNILILTPIHPIQIAEMNELYKKFSQYNNVYSIQAMALLAESINMHYIPANISFTNKLKDNPHLLIPKDKTYEHTIIYGNLDKRTNIKFDHIVAYTSHIAENETADFDLYLQESMKLMQKVYDETKNELAQSPQYYSIEDAHYTFPTLHHLFVFLKSLGIKENDNDGV